MLGPVSIGREAFDQAFPQPKNRFTFLDAGADANPPPSAAAADFSDASVHTGAAFTVVAILAGLAAAIMPARRASRLNVLDALHYE